MSQLRPERHGGASLQTAGVSHGSKDSGEQRSGGRREGPAAQSWCRAGALSHTFRVADGRGKPAIRRLDGLVRRRGLRLWHHARIRLRDGRGAGGASARSQRAPHRSPVCTAVDGERCRITLGPHGAAACSRRACFATPSAAACWRSVGGKSSARSCTPAGDPGVDWGVLCACRGVAGDVPGLWPGRRHARITQRRGHDGEPEPELYFLGVGG